LVDGHPDAVVGGRGVFEVGFEDRIDAEAVFGKHARDELSELVPVASMVGADLDVRDGGGHRRELVKARTRVQSVFSPRQELIRRAASQGA